MTYEAYCTNIETAQTYWERVAESSWGKYITAHERAAILAADQRLAKRDHGLEVGCEGGRWISFLHSLGWRMTAIDVDPQVLTICQRRTPDVRCVLAKPDSNQLPLADQSVSLILCIEVEPVMHSSWFPREAARVLRPGGELVGVAWNRRSLRGAVADLQSRARGRGSHPWYRHSYSAVRRNFISAGFELMSEVGLCWFPFSRASDSRLVPVAAWLEHRLRLTGLPSFSPWILLTARLRETNSTTF